MNRLEYNRAQSFLHYGRELDMEYSAQDEFGVYSLLRDFKLFQRGRRRTITHLLADERDLDFKKYIFDYQYVIGKNNARKYRKQTVLFFNAKALGLPQFSMEPEQLWHKLASWLKLHKDIDFEAYNEFSDSYFLTSEDEEYIRHIFNPDVLDFFTINKNWHIEGINYYLILYSHNERFHPKILPNFYRMGLQLFDLLKSHPDSIQLDQPLD